MHGGLQVLCVWRRVALAGTAPLKRLFRISSPSAIAMQPTFFTSPFAHRHPRHHHAEGQSEVRRANSKCQRTAEHAICAELPAQKAL